MYHFTGQEITSPKCVSWAAFLLEGQVGVGGGETGSLAFSASSVCLHSLACGLSPIFFKIFIYWLILEKEEGEERDIALLFQLFMHSSVSSRRCPDQELNLQPWCMGTTLQPTELPGQGLFFKAGNGWLSAPHAASRWAPFPSASLSLFTHGCHRVIALDPPGLSGMTSLSEGRLIPSYCLLQPWPCLPCLNMPATCSQVLGTSQGVVTSVWKERGHFLIFKDFIYLFLDRGEGKERGREISMCGCLSYAPYWGSGPQPRHVPWLGIKPATLWFTAGTQSTEPHQPGL